MRFLQIWFIVAQHNKAPWPRPMVGYWLRMRLLANNVASWWSQEGGYLTSYPFVGQGRTRNICRTLCIIVILGGERVSICEYPRPTDRGSELNDDDGGDIRDTSERDPLYWYYPMYSGNACSIKLSSLVKGFIPRGASLYRSVRPSLPPSGSPFVRQRFDLR